MIIGWRNGGRFDLGLLRVLPVVVESDLHAIEVVQFESGIQQGISDAVVDQRWPDRADQDGRAARPADDKAPDHDVSAGVDEAPGADVSQLRIGCLIKVDFNYTADT